MSDDWLKDRKALKEWVKLYSPLLKGMPPIDPSVLVGIDLGIERLELAVAIEREECAQLCTTMAEGYYGEGEKFMAFACWAAAYAIRERQNAAPEKGGGS